MEAGKRKCYKFGGMANILSDFGVSQWNIINKTYGGVENVISIHKYEVCN